MEDNIYCPLVDISITIDDCTENREIKEEYIPEQFKKKENWKAICQKCKYSNF